MEGLLYVCLFVLSVEGTTHISGLYCTDPDTGKLYEVNSTWPSETFCGNYTCRLTKANVTETEYTPVPKSNIIDNGVSNKSENNDEEIAVIGIKSDSKLTTDMDVSPSEVIKTIKKVSSDIKANASKENNTNKNKIKNNPSNMDGNKRDRYLTESEINVITDILHTVKKSDLEAIIEVYNLAEELYSEIEKTSKNNKENNIGRKPNVNVVSCGEKNDMNTEGTTSRYYTYPTNYYRESLTANDYYRYPYYYPVADYQRAFPYIYTVPQQVSNTWKPCANPKSNSIPASSTSARPGRANDDKVVTTSPYTSINIRENIEDYARYYYDYYPWAQLEMYNKNRLPYYINPYYSQAANTKPSKNVVTQPSEKSKIPKEVKPKKKVIEKEVPVKKTEEKKEMPKWKTEELSQKVIDEVKANVLEESKLLSIFPRRSIQLERVGKVIKLDELTRSKRQAENEEHVDFGVRLERIECAVSTEPGYFSVGNLSAPYPHCCPRKIT